jgi:hypothetical protein
VTVFIKDFPYCMYGTSPVNLRIESDFPNNEIQSAHHGTETD